MQVQGIGGATPGTNGASTIVSRADVLAELEAMPDATPAAPELAATETQTPTDAATDDGSPAVADAASDPGEVAPAVTEPPPPAAVDPDAELQRRMDLAHAAEKERKLTAREQEISAKEAEWKDRQADLERYERAKANAKHDPAAVLEALGIGDDELEFAARQIYARSPAAAKNPQARQMSEREQRDRQLQEGIRLANERAAKLEQTIAERDAQERERAYVDEAARAISDDHPVLRNLIKNTPGEARALLLQTAEHLLRATGEVPEHADVVRTLEQAKRTELKKLGIDVDQIFKAPTKNQTPAAGESNTAKTLTSDLGKSTPPRSAPMTQEELRADVLRRLEEGRLE